MDSYYVSTFLISEWTIAPAGWFMMVSSVAVSLLILNKSQNKNRKGYIDATKKTLDVELDYEPTSSNSVVQFRLISDKSQCIFAKRSILWGSPDYDASISIENNTLKCLTALLKFVQLADKGEKLDGFVIQIKDDRYGSSVETFAAAVRIVLKTISRNDPTGLSCMDMKSILTSSWYFSYATVPIFVTTFGPCYKPSHSRYMFLDSSSLDRSCYILLQPEISFLRHGLDVDTPLTNWDHPLTAREKIRVNFREHGRSYHIPATLSYPVSLAIVPSESNDTLGLAFWDEQLFPDVN